MNRKSIAAVALALVAVLVLWYQFLWSPKGDDLDSARQARTTAEQSRDQVRQQLTLAQQQHQGDNDAQIQAQRQQLEGAIPAKPDLEGFIRAAYDIKQKAGVDWVSIQPTPPANGTTGTEIAMQILVRGGYFQVLDYLNRLEDLKRVVVIDGVDLTTGDNAASSGGSSGGSTTPTTTSSGSAPTLAVTLTARMFTQATASGVPGSGTGVPGGVTPTTAATGTTATTAGGNN